MFLDRTTIDDFPDWMPPKERQEVVTEGMNRVSYDKSLGFYALAIVVPATMCALIWLLLPKWPQFARIALLIASTAIVGKPLIAWQKRVFLRSIRGVLREHGVNLCTACGYSLAGIGAGAACPECGSPTKDMPPVGPVVCGFVVRGDRVSCSECGYDLKGLSSPKACPECGGRIEGMHPPA